MHDEPKFRCLLQAACGIKVIKANYVSVPNLRKSHAGDQLQKYNDIKWKRSPRQKKMWFPAKGRGGFTGPGPAVSQSERRQSHHQKDENVHYCWNFWKRNLLLSEFYILRRIIIAAFSWGRWHTSYFLLVIGNANASLAYLLFVAETTETSFVSSRNLCWKNCRFCWGKNSGGKWLFPFLYSEFNYGRCNLSAKVKSDLQLFS